MDVMGGKIKINLIELRKIEKEETRAHGKELEAHHVEKGRLSCENDAPQVGSARSDWTRVVKVNHHKTNCRKTRRHCTLL
jgi:hypothetical protein